MARERYRRSGELGFKMCQALLNRRHFPRYLSKCFE
jgi:hypothetical protein